MYSVLKLLSVTAIIAFATMALALAQNEHVAQYQAYNEALEAGDYAAAETHAENAWRAAEEELGNNQTTAILAYNFANFIYYTRPEAAKQPIERVIELMGEDSDLFGVESPALMLLLIEAYLDRGSREKESALRATLSQFEQNAAPPNLLAARSWLHMSTREMLHGRYERAEESADFSIRHYAPFEEEATLETANAYISGGIARIAGRSRNPKDLQNAADLFEHAIDLFPPQNNIETFNPKLASALAWLAAADSAAMSDAEMRSRTASPRLRRTTDIEFDPKIKWASPQPSDKECNLQWDYHGLPKFPNSALARRYIGAVMIGYHFDGKKVTGARVLAEVPTKSDFGEATLDSVSRWTLSEEAPPECQNDRLMFIKFTIIG